MSRVTAWLRRSWAWLVAGAVILWAVLRRRPVAPPGPKERELQRERVRLDVEEAPIERDFTELQTDAAELAREADQEPETIDDLRDEWSDELGY